LLVDRHFPELQISYHDSNLEETLYYLAEKFQLRVAIETGTGSGTMTRLLARVFDFAHTVEIDSEAYVAGMQTITVLFHWSKN